MKPRAILFDFDGTLADSYPSITSSVNHVRAAHGLSPLSIAEVRRHVGHGPEHLLTHTVPGTHVEVDLARYRAHHPTVMREGTRLLPGTLEVITALHQAGIRQAVCSNKPVSFTRALLDHLQAAQYLDLVLGPEDVGRVKPAPDMLLAALARLRIRPEEAIYVGDMVVDIETARAAGIPVWVVATGSEEAAQLRDAKPDRFLHEIKEILIIMSAHD